MSCSEYLSSQCSSALRAHMGWFGQMMLSQSEQMTITKYYCRALGAKSSPAAPVKLGSSCQGILHHALPSAPCILRTLKKVLFEKCLEEMYSGVRIVPLNWSFTKQSPWLAKLTLIPLKSRQHRAKQSAQPLRCAPLFRSNYMAWIFSAWCP